MQPIANQPQGTEHVFSGLCLAAVVTLSFLFFVAPTGYGTFTVVSVVMLAVAILSLVIPAVLPYFVLGTSVFSSMLRNADTVTLGGTTVSLSGLLWIWVGAIAIAVLIINYRRVQFRGPFFGLLVFTGWVVLRWLGTPTGVGLRDVLFYALPGLLAIYTGFLLAENQGRITERIRWLLLCTAAVPPIAYGILVPVGLVTFRDIGPEGLVDPRAISEYLLIVLSLAASQWHYGPTAKARTSGLAISILCLATTVLTLSRAAALTGVIILGAARANVGNFRKLVLSVVTIAALITCLIWFVPALRGRFTGPSGVVSDEFPYINDEGRIFFWAVTAEHAIEKPILGWGPGSARLLVGAALPHSEYEEYHPHNDYLQAFHDLGFIGLTLMLLGWIPLVRVHWRHWRACDAVGGSIGAQWHMAAVFALAVVLLNAAVGNTLHETYVAAPALIISACAFSCTAAQSQVEHNRS